MNDQSLQAANAFLAAAASSIQAGDLLDRAPADIGQDAGLPNPLAVARAVRALAARRRLEVQDGKYRLLDARPGPVWMVELTNLGTRYGNDDAGVYAMFAERGYRPLVYVAADSRFAVHEGSEAGNLIFAREPEAASARLSAGRLVPI